MSKVYLSGPIRGLTYAEGQSWRTYAKTYLSHHGIDGFSPLRAKEYLDAEGVKLVASEYDYPLSTKQAIITRDRWDTTRCDVMLVNVLGAQVISIGTMVEIGWADAARVPIILAIEKEGNVHEHSMLRGLAGFHLTTLEEALNVTVALLKP